MIWELGFGISDLKDGKGRAFEAANAHAAK